MSIFASRLGLALVLAALCLGGRTAHAQAAPVTYWISSWPIGFGGNPSAGQSSNAQGSNGQGSNTYGNFPSFDGSDARGGGFSNMRYNFFPNGWFVGGEGGGMGLSMNGINQAGAFGNIYYEGVQFGYNFKNAGGLPLTVYAGFDTLKYNSGIGGPFAPFDSVSGTLPGYSAHAGVEFQPTSNVSLSLGFGYTQQPGRIDGDINSLSLPGASPFAASGRR
jgi:opacity protein-like surface antigen